MTPRQKLDALVKETSLFEVMDMMSDICIDISVQKGTSVPDAIALGLRALRNTAKATLDELGGSIREL